MSATTPPPRDPRSLMQEIVDCSSTVFWMTDAQDATVYVYQEGVTTDAHREIFVLGNWFAFVHPEDRDQLGPFVRKAWQAHEAYRVRYRVMRSDGSVRWVLGTSAPRFGADGHFEGFIGAIVDLSDQNPGMMAVENATAHQLIADNSTDLISHHLPSGEYLYVSPSVKRALGWDPHEMLGTNTFDYMPPEDRARVQEELRRQTRDGKETGLIEHRFRARNGDYVWLATKIRLIFDPAGDATVGAIAICRDITQERQAREELRRSEERFRSLTALSSDWYWEIDAQGRFTFLSDGLHRRWNSVPADFIGKTRHEVAADPGQASLAEYQGYLDRREPFRDLVYSSTVGRDAGMHHASISGEPVFEDGVFTGYRGVGRDITREIEVARQLRLLATHDTLTGLPNRALLHEQLNEMIGHRAASEQIAVLFIDLDRFKEVNDSMGHVPGDLLLREVAQRLRAAIGAQDLVARLGGDEFVVCARVTSREGAARLAQSILLALDTPASVLGHDVFVHASVGIALCPEHGDTKDLLFQNADTAMYQAKSGGRNCYRFFEQAMAVQVKARLVLETSMHRALEQNEFELHYQPRLALRTGEVIGMEALIRWNHPQLGRVSPLEFIPLAEERGFIGAIGRWVLEEACRQTRRLIDRFGKPLQVSVNLSARQLHDPALADDVVRALSTAGLDAGHLELELTESALVEDMDASVELFRRLKALGISLAVDDFGTGYSGLSYLGRFPFDTLKLDRSLVHQEAQDMRRVVRAFVAMAHSLDLAVVAEGVELAETHQFLASVGCDEAQGFLWSRPLPLDEFESYLAALLPSRIVRLR